MHCAISSSPGLPLTHLSSLCLCPSAKRRRWSEKRAACDASKANSSSNFSSPTSARQQATSASIPFPGPGVPSILAIVDISSRLLLPAPKRNVCGHGHLVLIKAAVYPLNPANAPTHERRRRQRLGNRWFGGEVEVATWRT